MRHVTPSCEQVLFYNGRTEKYCQYKRSAVTDPRRRLEEPGTDQAEKGSAVAEQPAQVVPAGAAEGYLPAKTWKPGEFNGGLAVGHCSWRLLKTAQFKSNARRIEKSVFMVVLHPDGEPLVGDNSSASGAVQRRFLIRTLRIRTAGIR